MRFKNPNYPRKIKLLGMLLLPKLATSQFVLFLVLGLVVSCWYYFVFAHPLTIWGVPEDAPIMSLAQAINFDFWLSQPGERSMSQAQFYQPGLLFQVFSWFIYRITAAIPLNSALELFRTHAMEPERFWIGTKVMALLISMASVVLVWKSAKSYGAMTTLVATLIYFACNPSIHYGVHMFWNESFTLMLAVLFFTYSGSVLNSKADIKTMSILCLGVFTGFLYMHKLNYVVWGAALLPALLVKYYFEKRSIKRILVHSVLFLTSTAASVFVLGLLLLEKSGFKEMLFAHKEIFVRSGTYGSGAGSVVSTAAIANGAQSVWDLDPIVALFFIIFILSVSVAIIYYRKNRAWLKDHAAEAILLIGAMTLTGMAVLKHYQPHYTVAIAAMFPLLILWLQKVTKKNWIILFLPFIVYGIVQNFNYRRDSNLLFIQREAEALLDEAEILKMPLDEGQKIFWMYRVNVPSFQRLFALDFAASRSLQSEVMKIQGEQWLASPWQSMVWTPEGSKKLRNTNWRYIIVSKNNLDWINPEMHPWSKDSQYKVISMRQYIVYENPYHQKANVFESK